MSSYSVTEPSGRQKLFAGTLVILYALITILPLLWIIGTSFKSPSDAIAYPPKTFFQPTVEGYVNLFTTRTRATEQDLKELGEPTTWYDRIVRKDGFIIAGPSRFMERFSNSIIIGFGSTVLCIVLGTAAAYAFSRFKVPLKDDLLFFILSTRMMPPIAVAIPIFLMFRSLGLNDTHLGMILLYMAVNLSLAVWLLKGFIDEIPIEYEEAALIDGYTRFQAFYKVVLPQAMTGIASTAIFCLIFAWNEYAFAVLLTSGTAQTAPLHSHHHRRRRSGLAGSRRRCNALPRSCHDFHDCPSQALCCAASRSELFANDRLYQRVARIAARRVGDGRIRPHRTRCLHADATVRAVDVFLLVHRDPGGHGDVHHRQPLSGVTHGTDQNSECAQGVRSIHCCPVLLVHGRRRRVFHAARTIGLRQDDNITNDGRPRAANQR